MGRLECPVVAIVGHHPPEWWRKHTESRTDVTLSEISLKLKGDPDKCRESPLRQFLDCGVLYLPRGGRLTSAGQVLTTVELVPAECCCRQAGHSRISRCASFPVGRYRDRGLPQLTAIAHFSFPAVVLAGMGG